MPLLIYNMKEFFVMIKAKIGNVMYDVIDYEEYRRNRSIYGRYPGNIAISPNDGSLYPIRPFNDIRPGFYECGGIDIFKPPYGNEMAMYSTMNQIDFSKAKNYKEVIEAQDRLNQSERAILTTMNNITIPEIHANDTPAMKALKQAIINKKIDLDSYDHRFGVDNYPNDKRLLRRDTITLSKLKTYANALDLEVTLTLQDKDPSVPNPMGKVISVSINGEDTAVKQEDN